MNGMEKTKSWFWYVTIFLTLVAYFMLGYLINRHQTMPLMLCFGVLFLIYGYWIRQLENLPFKTFLVLAVCSRFLFAFSLPQLSDDYFRFIWDGVLWLNGINPFSMTPAEVMEQYSLARLQELYPDVYGKHFLTVYPPLAQLMFSISAAVSSETFYSVLMLRAFVFLAEAGTLWVLWKILRELRLPNHLIFIYALNPLIILEFSGNLHHEAFVIFFMTASIWYVLKKKEFLASLSFTGAVLSKLLPIIFLPSLLFATGRKAVWKVIPVIVLISLLGFLLMGGVEILSGLGQGLSLYYQKFEFNPSLWFVVRAIGQEFTGYNILSYAGPALAVIAGLWIVYLSFGTKLKSTEALQLRALADKWILLLSIYLIFSPIVHPWYITPMILFSVFGSYRFPLWWSGLIMLTYSGYQIGGYVEKPMVLAIEYFGVLSIFIIEWNQRKKQGV